MNAISPNINATVTASAGSGKTWLLVSRIVRLMLAGHAPGGILALTFTRKAASEMQQRLAQRLYELATVDDAQLDKLLKQLELQPTAQIKLTARALYQQHQYCDYPLRAQTFHAFCQDILARFPLEADVPPGFALLDNETLLKNRRIFGLIQAVVHKSTPQALQEGFFMGGFGPGLMPGSIRGGLAAEARSGAACGCARAPQSPARRHVPAA